VYLISFLRKIREDSFYSVEMYNSNDDVKLLD